MSMPRNALAATLATLLTLGVAACSRDDADTAAAPALPDATEAPATEPVTTDAPPEMAGECNADAVQSFVGQEATQDAIERARVESGAATVRALKPGDAGTMDFRPDRLDIALDENSIIQTLHCG
ncbi:MAG: I78 family peptidase inhibitor [Luteimonas sp.]|nr:I78 family peptidase inhibitor [Luteimonas sp.]